MPRLLWEATDLNTIVGLLQIAGVDDHVEGQDDHEPTSPVRERLADDVAWALSSFPCNCGRGNQFDAIKYLGR